MIKLVIMITFRVRRRTEKCVMLLTHAMADPTHMCDAIYAHGCRVRG